MRHAIEELRLALAVLETNEPINRNAGFIAQADLEKAEAESYRKAIAVLEDLSVETTFKDRVIAENRELDGRLAKLDAFIFTNDYCSLSWDEQVRLREQSSAMHKYADILGERIAAFE